MTIEQIKELSKEIHEGNAKRGFWDDERSLSEVLILIRTEMSEAVESDRKGIRFNLPFNKEDERITRQELYKYRTIDNEEFNPIHFKTYVKDTVEDELADVIIRILDLPSSPVKEVDWVKFFSYYNYWDSKKISIPFSIYSLAEWFNYYMPYSFDYDIEQLSHSLVFVLNYCKGNNIDIWWHVREKLKYNATRPYKHGKKY